MLLIFNMLCLYCHAYRANLQHGREKEQSYGHKSELDLLYALPEDESGSLGVSGLSDSSWIDSASDGFSSDSYPESAREVCTTQVCYK